MGPANQAIAGWDAGWDSSTDSDELAVEAGDVAQPLFNESVSSNDSAPVVDNEPSESFSDQEYTPEQLGNCREDEVDTEGEELREQLPSGWGEYRPSNRERDG